MSRAGSGDRLALSYVLCGPARGALDEHVGHSLTRERPDGGGEVFQAFGSGALRLGGSGGGDRGNGGADSDEGPFCDAARLVVPEYTLMPGRYAFVVHRPDAPREAILGALAESPDGSASNAPETGAANGDPGSADPILARLTFEIR